MRENLGFDTHHQAVQALYTDLSQGEAGVLPLAQNMRRALEAAEAALKFPEAASPELREKLLGDLGSCRNMYWSRLTRCLKEEDLTVLRAFLGWNSMRGYANTQGAIELCELIKTAIGDVRAIRVNNIRTLYLREGMEMPNVIRKTMEEFADKVSVTCDPEEIRKFKEVAQQTLRAHLVLVQYMALALVPKGMH